MTAQIRLDLSTLGRALAAVEGRLKDTNAVLRAAGSVLLESTIERFKTGLAPDGEPWKPSRRARFADLNIALGKAKAQRRKPRPGSVARPNELGSAELSGKTLVKSGQLRNSISMRVAGGVLTIGSAALYARVHQFGATIVPKSAPYLKFKLPGGPFISTRKVTIPARPFLGVSAQDRLEVEEEIVARFDDLVKGA